MAEKNANTQTNTHTHTHTNTHIFVFIYVEKIIAVTLKKGRGGGHTGFLTEAYDLNFTHSLKNFNYIPM